MPKSKEKCLLWPCAQFAEGKGCHQLASPKTSCSILFSVRKRLLVPREETVSARWNWGIPCLSKQAASQQGVKKQQLEQKRRLINWRSSKMHLGCFYAAFCVTVWWSTWQKGDFCWSKIKGEAEVKLSVLSWINEVVFSRLSLETILERQKMRMPPGFWWGFWFGVFLCVCLSAAQVNGLFQGELGGQQHVCDVTCARHGSGNDVPCTQTSNTQVPDHSSR